MSTTWKLPIKSMRTGNGDYNSLHYSGYTHNNLTFSKYCIGTTVFMILHTHVFACEINTLWHFICQLWRGTKMVQVLKLPTTLIGW